MSDAILVIDPGKVSGIALLDEDLEKPAKAELTVADTLECFESAVKRYPDLMVVMESYIISERTIKVTPSSDALDLIGYVKLRCLREGISFKLQTPAQAKAFATDDKLKALGWYERTKDGHANDACRHMLVYLVQNEKQYSNEHIIPRLAKEILGEGRP